MKRIFLLVICLFTVPCIVSAVTVEIVGTVPGCGDGVVVVGEQCDTSDFGGASCSSLGFTSGTLSCTSACTINASACTAGISGGSSGGSVVFIPSTNVVFVGHASPQSMITLLKDGQTAASTTATADASFQTSLSGLSAGNYVFSLYSEDNKGVRSSALTFPVFITSSATTKVSGIFIAPTIMIDKVAVKRGDIVTIVGQSTPASEITLSVGKGKEFLLKKKSDALGVYSFFLDTSLLDVGMYYVKTRSTLGSESSSFGKTVNFLVSGKNSKSVEVAASKKNSIRGDFSGDKRVNLTDFSIILYWYKRPLPPSLVDMNGDGKVTLVDFSIFIFHWTG